jgi:hypothetical protein
MALGCWRRPRLNEEQEAATAAAQAERATGGREDRIFEQEIAEIAKKSRGFQIGFGSSREDQDGIKMLDNNKNNR